MDLVRDNEKIDNVLYVYPNWLRFSGMVIPRYIRGVSLEVTSFLTSKNVVTGFHW